MILLYFIQTNQLMSIPNFTKNIVLFLYGNPDFTLYFGFPGNSADNNRIINRANHMKTARFPVRPLIRLNTGDLG